MVDVRELAGSAGVESPGPGVRREREVSRVRGLRVCDGILETVGSTPLVRLRRYLPRARFALYGKLEGLNPGGSLKDRPAARIIEHALRSGELRPGAVVVESSSGNMGIGLAQACRFHGLRLICVVDPKTTEANLRVMRAFGAEIDLVTEPDPETGELLQARLKRVRELLDAIPGSYWPNQYANSRNSDAHYQTTMREVVAALNGKLDFLFVATSTCGTLRGCCDYVRDHELPTQVIAVDAFGSRIFDSPPAKRLVPGLGASLRPPLCEPAFVGDCLHVNDLDCIAGCRRLMAREAIFAGGSSGGVMAAVEAYQERIPAGAAAVAILPDRGERYLDTLFSDDWVREQFGDVESLWVDPAAPRPEG